MEFTRVTPCKWCGKLVTNLGTKECNEHWELRSRIESEPDLALSIIRGIQIQKVLSAGIPSPAQASWLAWLESNGPSDALGGPPRSANVCLRNGWTASTETLNTHKITQAGLDALARYNAEVWKKP